MLFTVQVIYITTCLRLSNNKYITILIIDIRSISFSCKRRKALSICCIRKNKTFFILTNYVFNIFNYHIDQLLMLCRFTHS